VRYESGLRLFGLPLVHVAIGPSAGQAGVRGVAKGWIAIGDIAFGVLFALGGVAVGGLSVGGLAVGALSIAGLSVGIWSIGGLAIGVLSLGGAAVGLHAAEGGFALAREFAQGGEAIAQHANDAEAQAYISTNRFFLAAEYLARHARWLLILVLIGPAIAWYRRWRKI